MPDALPVYDLLPPARPRANLSQTALVDIFMRVANSSLTPYPTLAPPPYPTPYLTPDQTSSLTSDPTPYPTPYLTSDLTSSLTSDPTPDPTFDPTPYLTSDPTPALTSSPWYRAAWCLGLTHPALLLVLGLPLNVATVLEVGRKWRASSHFAYVTALSVVDSLLLTHRALGCYLPWSPVPMTWWTCAWIQFVVQTSSQTSSWILVSLCFERAVVVKFPFRRLTTFTPGRALQLIAALGVTLALLNSVTLVAVRANPQHNACEYRQEFLDQMRVVWYRVEALTYAFLPFLLLLLLNGVMVTHLRRSRGLRRVDIPRPGNNGAGSGQPEISPPGQRTHVTQPRGKASSRLVRGTEAKIIPGRRSRSSRNLAKPSSQPCKDGEDQNGGKSSFCDGEDDDCEEKRCEKQHCDKLHSDTTTHSDCEPSSSVCPSNDARNGRSDQPAAAEAVSVPSSPTPFPSSSSSTSPSSEAKKRPKPNSTPSTAGHAHSRASVTVFGPDGQFFYRILRSAVVASLVFFLTTTPYCLLGVSIKLLRPAYLSRPIFVFLTTASVALSDVNHVANFFIYSTSRGAVVRAVRSFLLRAARRLKGHTPPDWPATRRHTTCLYLFKQPSLGSSGTSVARNSDLTSLPLPGEADPECVTSLKTSDRKCVTSL